jgi:hypothetical protein
MKLQVLKRLTKNWSKEKMKRRKAKMLAMEEEIKEIIKNLVGDPTNQGTEATCRQLETERNDILRQEEEQWRLHRRALWLASGDSNTKYFHNLAPHNRVKNHIWDIKGINGDLENDQVSLKKEAILYYKKIYKASFGPNTVEQCKLIEYYPQMIDEANSTILFNSVTMEELK